MGSGDWVSAVHAPVCRRSALLAQKRADGRQQKAAAFVKALYDSCDRVAIENPVGVLSSVWRKPDQYVQPWWFGHPYTKKTGLWLKGLPPLEPTDEVKPTATWCSNNQSWRRRDGTRVRITLPPQRELAGSSRQRSLTFEGLANAMAEQWG